MKQGSFLNKGSVLEGKNYIGRDTRLNNVRVGFGSYVNSRCDISNTRIGKYTSIGAGVTTELGSHPLDGRHVALHPAFYKKEAALGYSYADKDTYKDMKYIDEAARIQVVIGNDVWIGNNVSILEGVTIGDGAVVAAGSLVNKDIEPYGIYAGVPARKVKERFDTDDCARLLRLKWWDMKEEEIKKLVKEGAFDDKGRFNPDGRPDGEV
ncbi:MAG: CatB-related O-acetyltransferase [Lachnospiraceae bacterium]|nr:CatB-related O-acetyltransferase [Lachnospiraceae bacterium]